MQTDSASSHSAGTTWLRRASIALASFAVAALAMFGGVAMGSPDAPPDDQAGATWSFTVGDDDCVSYWGGGKCGPGAGTHGATWS